MRRSLAVTAVVVAALLAGTGIVGYAAHSSHASNVIDGVVYWPSYYEYQQVARNGLVDPDSAKFRNLYFRRYGGSLYLCGEVNSRNRMGGYTGYHLFNTTRSAASFWGESGYINDVVVVACR